MKKFWLLLIVPVLGVWWWVASGSAAIPEVHFTRVEKVRLESTISTNGKAEPGQWAEARAEIPGIVRTVSIHRGDQVVAGQTLISLDTAAAESDLAAALAREQEAKTESQILGQGGKAAVVANLTDAVAAAKAALTVAQRNYEAIQRLAAQQAATRLQLLEAKDAVDRAKLMLAAAQNQSSTIVTSSDKVVADARVRDAIAAVALARHRLALATVTAPMAGTVYQFDTKVGAYVQIGDSVALVGNLKQMKVKVYIDEPDLGRISEGLPVRITWDARPGQQWIGRVNQMPTQVVALGTRTVGEVATIVDNPESDLLPGVSVNALITSKVAADALSIPKAALRTVGGQTGAFKQAGKTVVWTPVTTGISDVNRVQILAGLQAGDLVLDRVVEPSDAEIKNGMRVRGGE